MDKPSAASGRDIVDTVNRYCAREGLLKRSDRVLVAVSGGADSLALLHILWRLADELELELRVVSIDHQLRGERGRADVEHVRNVAGTLGLPFLTEAVDVPALIAEKRLSPEDAARRARYEALSRFAQAWGPGPAGPPRVAVGHTQDDQAETVLMRIIEGTGLDGLGGIPPHRVGPGWVVIRPLLEVSREEVELYCTKWGLQPVEDETNRDLHLRRNRLRLEILPALAAVNPKVSEALTRLAELAREEGAVMSELADRHLRRLLRAGLPPGEGPFRGLELAPGSLAVIPLRPFLRLSPALQRRLARAIVERLAGPAAAREIGRAGIDDVRQSAARLRVGGRLQLAGGVLLEKGYRHLCFGLVASPGGAPAAGQGLSPFPAPVPLVVPGRTELPELGWSFETRLVHDLPAGGPGGIGPREAESFPGEQPEPEAHHLVIPLGLDNPAGDAAGLAVRTRRPGDAFRPIGLNGTKKLKDLFISAKVPRSERDRWPLLVDAAGTILWVVGLQADERVGSAEKDAPCLVVIARRST